GRLTPSKRLEASFDEIYADEVDEKYNIDTVERKLFVIGSEAFVVVSHEFYFVYALINDKLLLLHTDHDHTIVDVSRQIDASMLYSEELALHVASPVRWDSDHVIVMDDEVKEVALELVRNDALDKVSIGLDFFDASINRVAAWTIGTRNMIKALLYAMLSPN